MSRAVVVSQQVPAELLRPLEDIGFEVHMRDDDRPAPSAELARMLVRVRAEALISLLTDRIDAPLLDATPTLRTVSTVAAGFDNIDVPAAAARGIIVCHTPDALTEATADLTLALVLATARRIPEGDAFLRSGAYTRWKLDQAQTGLDVSGSTIGIIGMGKIGRAVARRCAAGFGMKVLYTSRSRLSPQDEASWGVEWSSFEGLLEASDFVSLHAPLTEHTRHLIDQAALRRMRRSAVVVNTSRGPLIDEVALARALSEGWIAGAGLDVYEHEPQVTTALLGMRERVVLLPHLGSATTATRRRMVATAVDNALAVLQGREPDHPVAV
jgi:glyoxylate reductase